VSKENYDNNNDISEQAAHVAFVPCPDRGLRYQTLLLLDVGVYMFRQKAKERESVRQ
jgi:hypothetical protein